MTSVKIRTSWTDENVVTEGVRIYKSNANFDVNSKPAPLAEILDGREFYEDFDVEENETVYYMLSCFLGEQEVFTECYEVVVTKQIDYVPLSLIGGVSKSSPSGTTQATSRSISEPSGSDSTKILICIVTSFVSVSASADWKLLSNLNNVHVFWKKGIAPSVSHVFTAASSSFMGCYMFLLQPAATINKMSCVSKMQSTSTTVASPTALAPILDVNEQIDGDCFELAWARVNNISGVGVDGSAAGYSTIATYPQPSQTGSIYQLSLMIFGKHRNKGDVVGGGVINMTAGGQPNTLITQTIQLCAYYE